MIPLVGVTGRPPENAFFFAGKVGVSRVLFDRRPGVPVGNALVLMGDVQQPGFVEIGASQLKSDRTAGVFTFAEAARNGHARQTGQVGRQRENVGQITGYWIVSLVTQVPGHGRGNRPHDDVAFPESVFEVFGD